MKQSAVVLVLSWLVCVSPRVAAQETFTLDEVEGTQEKAAATQSASSDPKDVLTQALGARRWGMSKPELLKVLKAELRAQFEQRIKAERDIMRQDALYQEAQEQYRRIHENYVQFDGTKTGWDVSPVAAEFTQGNDEAMLVVRSGSTRELYFFMHGKLWKWYREFAADAQGTAAAEGSVRSLGERLGRGKPQQDRLNDAKEAYPGVSWLVANTRVTALRRGQETCLILEDKSVVDRLATLRGPARLKQAKAQAAQSIDWALMGPDREAQAQQ